MTIQYLNQALPQGLLPAVERDIYQAALAQAASRRSGGGREARFLR